MNELEEIRSLLLARQLAKRALADAVREWLQRGDDRALLARALGIDRTTLYRRYLWADDRTARGGQGRPEAGEANP